MPSNILSSRLRVCVLPLSLENVPLRVAAAVPARGIQLPHTLWVQGAPPSHAIEVWKKGVCADTFNPRFRSRAMRERLSCGHPDAPILLSVGRLGNEKNLKFLRVHTWHAGPWLRCACTAHALLRLRRHACRAFWSARQGRAWRLWAMDLLARSSKGISLARPPCSLVCCMAKSSVQHTLLPTSLSCPRKRKPWVRPGGVLAQHAVLHLFQ